MTAAAIWSCRVCQLASTPGGREETVMLAAAHDHVHHGGARTAVVATLPAPSPAPGAPVS